jgi:DNA-binding Lrp family transcriptional regulator
MNAPSAAGHALQDSAARFAFRLLNESQRGFPLTQAPYATLAAQLGSTQARVIDLLAVLRERGVLSRVGAVFAPGAIGASTLAAIDVPAGQLRHAACVVSARPEVNHNYEREGRPNLWFVLTAESEVAVASAAREIEAGVGCGPVLLLPLIEEYRIDLGFALDEDPGTCSCARMSAVPRPVLSHADRRLIAALQPGLALHPHPYRLLAREAGMTQRAVLQRLREWIQCGVVRRLGLVLRHRELGYRDNAMVVWDVPDALVSDIGHALSQQPGVTLCYRRRRAPGHWPFNLYCMIHGRERHEVLARLEAMTRACGLDRYPSRVLFSRTRFKQRGAHYVPGSAP